jgi:spermidine synthase
MSFLGALFSSGLAGFVALSYELVWFRCYSLASGSGPGSFGVLLGAYLLGVALGSMLARRFCVAGKSKSAATLEVLSLFVFVANILGFLVVPCLAFLCTLNRWGLTLILIGHAAASLGAALPLLSHYAVPADEHSGLRVSQLYMANIVGCCAGSLITGYLLLDLFSLRTIATILSVLGSCLCLYISGFGGVRTRMYFRVATGLSFALMWAGSDRLFSQIYERILYKSEFTKEVMFAHVIENRHGVIAVTPDKTVFGSGAYDGVVNSNVVDGLNGLERAYAMVAVNDSAKEVLMIGLATGAWAQVIANMPQVEKLTVVEINPGYLELIPLFPEVASLLTNPKVEIIIDDGRRFMRRHPERKFDFVVANTTWHWRAYTSNLLSVEYLELVRAHLRPGGGILYNTTWSDEAQRTAAITFPYAMRIGNFMTASDSPFVFDADRWKKTLINTTIDGRPNFDLSDPKSQTRLAELLRLPNSIDEEDSFLETREHLLNRTRNLDVVTDDNMICEFGRAK